MSSMAGSLIKASIRNAPTVAATAAVALVVSVASLFGGVPGGYESDSAADCAEEEDDLPQGRRRRRRRGGRGHRERTDRRYVRKDGECGGGVAAGGEAYGGITRSVSWSDELGEELASVIQGGDEEAEEYYEEFDYDEDGDGDSDDYREDSKNEQNVQKSASVDDKGESTGGGGGGGAYDIKPQSGGAVTPGWGFYVSITPDEHKKYAAAKKKETQAVPSAGADLAVTKEGGSSSVNKSTSESH